MAEYPQVNQVIGKYPLLSILGKGATAWVYKSYHQLLKTYVAIKVLSPNLNERNAEAKEIFFEEAINLTKMSHPGLIKIMDAEVSNGYSYIIMDYIDGDTVEYLINRDSKIDPVDAVKIAIKVCHTLDYTSSFNLVHRDVKPANIMVDPNFNVKLLDFGLSKFINQPVKFNLIAGPMCGSLFYMSPEQLTDSERVNASSDFYSIGATLYHMVTGRVPFKTDNLSEIISMHISQIPEEPSKLNPKIVNELSHLIMKLLEKVPSKRYKSYDEIIRELEKIQNIYENNKNQVVADVILAHQIAQAEQNLSSSPSDENDLQLKFFNALKKSNFEQSDVKISPKINVPTIVTSKDDKEESFSNTDSMDLSGLREKFLSNVTAPDVSSRINDEIKIASENFNNSFQNKEETKKEFHDTNLSELQKKFLKNISSL
jgi:serine/threonine protein kinase